jgi:large subunit ribosomal protein L10
MAKKEKELLVEQLSEKLKNNNGVVVTEYQGLTVAEITELRNKLRVQKCEYKVVKNTFSRKALEKIGLNEFAKYFEGPIAIAIENGDPVEASKILVDFAKEHEKLKLKAGVMGAKTLTVADIKAIATLPPREVLLAQVLGTLQSPITGFVNVLNAVLVNFVSTLDQIRKQKEENK